MSVDLTKGATVELVKTLSDDLRTKSDSTKWESAGAAIRAHDAEISNVQSDLRENSAQIGVINEELYKISEKTITISSNGWKLKDDGLSARDEQYKLMKYSVSSGERVKVVSDFKFQFQTSENVPASGSSTRVGGTYGEGTYYLTVPDTATYLIVSTTLNGNAIAYNCKSIIDSNSVSIDQMREVLNYGYVVYDTIVNGGFNNSGVLNNNNNRLRASDYIWVKSGDRIAINPGSLVRYLTVWKDSPALSNLVYYDSTYSASYIEFDVEYDGCFMVAFANATDQTQVLSVDDYDAEIKVYSRLFIEEAYNNVPEYYMQDNYLTSKVERINSIGEQSDDVFFFITDVHWERNAKHSPALMRYLADRCRIPKLFDGGDIADGISLQAIDAFRNAFTGNIYKVIGNHEWFYPSTGKALYYWYNSLNTDQIGNAYAHYWYVDNVQTKIRYITLNSFVHTGGSVGEWEYGFDTDQTEWFAETALNVPAGYDVIVITHYIRNNLSKMDGASAIENAISEFNADTTSGHGKVICVFEGHRHWDSLFYTDSGVPIVLTTCDKYDVSNEPTIAEEVRTLNTINEQAFELVAVNRTTGTIHCVRIGAKAQDNVNIDITQTGFSFNQIIEERIVHYMPENVETTKSLTSVTIPSSWYTSNPAVCTVNDGTVAAVGSGMAYVYSISATNQLEAWVVIVS